jgi:hypothetical protein
MFAGLAQHRARLEAAALAAWMASIQADMLKSPNRKKLNEASAVADRDLLLFDERILSQTGMTHPNDVAIHAVIESIRRNDDDAESNDIQDAADAIERATSAGHTDAASLLARMEATGQADGTAAGQVARELLRRALH